ncbi:MAG TPA: tetratricopeptide repeat protein [Pseudomonadales bacterium]|nr:tetratricopeptide repeat protein [Pseudomonadales bacterium]
MRVGVCILLVMLPLVVRAAEFSQDALISANRAMVEARQLMLKGDDKAATDLLEAANARFPNNFALLMTWGQALYNTGRYGLAEIQYKKARAISDTPVVETKLTEIEDHYQAFTRSINIAVIEMQRNTDAGNYATTIAIGNRAIAKFPGNDVLYKEKGAAQYKKGDLADAEATLRKALQINPLNREARQMVEDIRNTESAQTSAELAQWIAIAKDKVGDFIVTFLALFAAFVVNSAVDPIILSFKLNRARRHFEHGNYDEFTDLIEGLLDLENFAPLRANFRFMLRQKSFDEAKEILNKYVNTLERLPTLVRILERENEKMLADSD